MGVYLSEPNTNKDIKEGSGNGVIYCKAEMQGWRKNMEDAAIHQVDLADGNALFGVFDGHGGTTAIM
jgi:serine/threonine protein phosphatase PrpC